MRLLRQALLATILSACQPSAAPAATIILVRHAERSAAMSSDAPLSPAGEARARILAHVLKDAGISRIYITEFLRTRQTAEPTAARLHLTPTVIKQNNIDGLIGELNKLGENETVLVVGHANTVPLIVDRLGAGAASAMPDTEYDRLTVVLSSTGGKMHAVTLRYGDATE